MGLFVIGMMGGFALGIAVGIVMMIYAEEKKGD
jgi:hypothetical protein